MISNTMQALLPFYSREDAGEQLAIPLARYRKKKNTLVFGLVRGGILIAYPLAKKLDLPMYPYIVRKVGHPSYREFGLGAISEGGAVHLDEALMKSHRIERKDINIIIEEELKELKRRKDLYSTEPRPSMKGKTIIITDDGAATGNTLFAVMRDLRKEHVKKIIIALPICPLDIEQRLVKEADEVHTLAMPTNFSHIGKWYVNFPQVSDEEVIELLKKS